MAKYKQKQQPDYDYRDTYEEYYGVAVVGKEGKFGYINSKGVEITPPTYDRALRFHWDIGRVQLNGKWGLVNKQGKEITPPVYDEIKGHQDPIVRIGDKYGFVSWKTGKLLTPVKYDEAKQWTQIIHFTSRKWGRKDLAEVRLDGKWGCINVRGEEIIPLKYDKIEINQSEDPRIKAELDGKWGFVNEKGKEITAFEYDDVEEFNNGLARVKKDGKYGFINKKGDVVIPLKYDDCEQRFSNTWHDDDRRILPAWIKRGEKYGFIDTSGAEIIQPEYEFALPFIASEERPQALAAVVLNGAAGFIDEAGKNVIPCIYEPDFDIRYNYCFYGNCANVKQGGKWGVIDVNNHVVIPFIYDDFLENCNAGFRYAMRDGNKWSVDAKGNEWVLKKKPDARTFKDYLYAVEWDDVAECFRTYFSFSEEDIEHYLKAYEINFYNFKSKKFKPSENIIRIHTRYYESEWECSPVDAHLFSVKDDCSYAIFDWDEILDMEVRIEDNLTLTDVQIIAVCIYEACDQAAATEKSIQAFLNKLDEQTKTLDENR